MAGNVETSQTITDTLYGALGVLAASQGTMNNFTFGNDTYQYYETIAGGAGAGPDFDGASVVQTHMTNSAAHRPGSARMALSGAARVVRDPPRQRRRGSPPRRRRHAPRVRFLEAMTAVVLANHRRIAPFGVAGGGPARWAATGSSAADGTREEFGATCKVDMRAGDVFVIETPGGGGFGAPAG